MSGHINLGYPEGGSDKYLAEITEQGVEMQPGFFLLLVVKFESSSINGRNC